MNEIVGFIIAQDQTARSARQALPDSPVIADVGFGPRQGRVVRLRAGISASLVALAERVSPEPNFLSDRGVALAQSGNTAPNAC